MASSEKKKRVQALKVNQWLKDWNSVKFSEEDHRRKPEPSFFILSIPAIELKGLCGISRRQAKGVRPRAADLGIQRQHEEERSEEIQRFVD
ncbi:MAG: hypothetical protein OJJ21_16065 [Ferrovibrio sp.]|uniref:hypothetical protein n=1 Tax=Ferrovibrio sp. TaxID=1917215 RepID=UPI002611CB64|nr:hypothetical protein [Ferrovibrio sp.]MCW0235118.1 hypothetical protein [Ferrovibrio sp.]